MIKITLPDGSVKEFEKGTSALQVAKSISEGLARNVLCAKLSIPSENIENTVWDAERPIHHDCSLILLTWNDVDGKKTFWHSSAHLLAEALEALYPAIKFGIGPPIEQGFYYDIDSTERPITVDDLPAIEEKMRELAKADSAFLRKDVSKSEALRYFKEKNDPYKLELIGDLEDGTISFYSQGNFTDLCRGPHIPHTGFIKAIKLTAVAGAYWRGNEKNKMLTRIYGISFPKDKELKEYLHFLEEAKKRDHRKLGRELGLFHFSEKVGMGLPLWLPKGAALRERLIRFMQKIQQKHGYQQVATPHIAHKNLYVTSGHLEKYGKDSFQPILTPHEGEEFFLKPMNCPHHCEIYKAQPRSYKELPLRLAEFGTVYRYEQHGELHGLTRVRAFTQDDAHLFCRPDQVKEEFCKVIDIVLHVLNALKFNGFVAQISLRDPLDKEKYIGSDENWNLAEQAIIESAKEKNLPTTIVTGEAAFYGPKLDFMVQDAIGRKWQLGTIQVDYNLPERFQLEYTGQDNQKHRPVMIHRAPFGSIERFLAVLIEHCAGNFPLWLAPEQVAILPISDKFNTYAQQVLELLNNSDIRAVIDDRDEKIQRKIRDHEVKKIPYMLIVGDKEMNQQTVSIRKHGAGDLGSFSISEFIQKILEETNLDFSGDKPIQQIQVN